MKIKNLTLETLMIKTNGGVAAAWFTLIIRDDGQTLEIK